MKKFELDTNYEYEDGQLLVIARTDEKVFFLKNGIEFYPCEIFNKNGNEAVTVYYPKTTLEADENAPCSPAKHSDIEEWINDAENAFDDDARKNHFMYASEDDFTSDDIGNLLTLVRLLKKRL